MPQQIINIGAAANDGTGDTWRDAMDKSNDNFTELYGITTFTKRVVVNSASDLPAPSGGVITLAASTQYLLANSINIGADRIVFSDGTALSGIESIAVVLTYTGAGDLFTMTNVTARVSNMTISAATGRLFNWSETTGKVLRANDVGVISCDKVGIFTGTTGVIRFTNFSPASVTTDGCEFVGNLRSFLWEVSAATMTAGALFNLGTATFDSFIAKTVLSTLNGTSNLISGATGSANINTGGQGTGLMLLTSGTGTPLAGVAPTDARWEFAHNDDIATTTRGATGHVIGNATVTTITTISTPVKVDFGTSWVAGTQDQWTSDNTGTHTYNGPDQSFHVTGSMAATNASGNGKVFRWYIAKNGTVDLNSVSEGTYDSTRSESVAITAVVDVTATDTIELYVENTTDTVNITASTGNLVIED